MKRIKDIFSEKNKTNIEGLNHISDEKHVLYYRFTPATLNPEGAPLLVILHGQGSKSATKFQHDNWNVLTPVDHFGYKQDGCWWLGEKGDFFLARLLQILIKKITQEYKCKNNIYFYGSSMGGYGAIYHGILANAKAIYANVPQAKFFPSTYFSELKKYGEYIFDMSKTLPIENNLLDLLNKKDTFPIFYLCKNICEKEEHLKSYLGEHTLAFSHKCYEYQIKAHIEILPQEGHTKNYGIGEVLDKFNKFTPPNKENKCKNTLNLLSDKVSWYHANNKSHLIVQGDSLSITDTFTGDSPTILYITSSNATVTQKKTSNSLIDVSMFSKMYLKVNMLFEKSEDISVFIQLFDEEALVSSSAFSLVSGKNSIDIPPLHNNIKYLKLLFRISSSTKELNINVSKATLCIEEKKQKQQDKLKNNNQTNLLPNIIHIPLQDTKILQEKEHTYSITKNGTTFNFYLNYKKNKKILIALPGATDRNKKFYNFQRYTWSENMAYSFMSVLDPTITQENDLSIGWFQGKNDHYALEKFIIVLKDILKENSIDEKDIILFGSSAGGFIALKMANHFPNSKIIAINPQIYVYNYSQKEYNKLINYSYSQYTKEEVLNLYKERLSITIDWTKRKAPIYYYQNTEDKHHLAKHLKPFLDKTNINQYNQYKKGNYITAVKKLYVFQYKDSESGHSPPNKEKTLQLIEDVMTNKIKKGYRWIF